MASRIEQGFQRQLQHLPDSTRRLLLAAAVEPSATSPCCGAPSATSASTSQRQCPPRIPG
jgi:hypothetical protein